MYVGYELNNQYCQICYSSKGKEEPVSVGAAAGSDKIRIPLVLYKEQKSERYSFGEEAQKQAEEGGGTLIKNLLNSFLNEEKTEIEEKSYDSRELLVVFIKKTFHLLSKSCPIEEIQSFVLTVSEVSPMMIELWKLFLELFPGKKAVFHLQGYAESFTDFIICQKEELWLHQTVLVDFRNKHLRIYCLEINRKTTPCIMDMRKLFDDMMRPEDEEFAEVMRRCLSNRTVSSIYLTGDSFEGGWLKESLTVMCRKGRVFQGENLYVKGACCGAKKYLEIGKKNPAYLYWNRDKLQHNIGMMVLVQGKETYYPFISAGINWYEAEAECDFIVDDMPEVPILLQSVVGKKRMAGISLASIPLRENKTVRLHLQLTLKAADLLHVRLEDRGFGELFPNSGLVLEEDVSLESGGVRV